MSVLAHGLGRSYGDSCLNDGHAILLTQYLKHFIAFDSAAGLLRAEAGTPLDDVLALVVPKGWFLPVTPGTARVTLGGAVANDVHGKNHYRAGSFGKYVTRFELLRSTGERLVCSREQHRDLFRATIGGLGLTGFIMWIELKLKPIASASIDMQSIRFSTLDEFFEIDAASERGFEYTVAWVDALDPRGRGYYLRGNHASGERAGMGSSVAPPMLTIPFECPEWLLNRMTLRAFNMLYYRRQMATARTSTVGFRSFFYPLDAMDNWNRLYGPRGFFQYQCVVPGPDGRTAIGTILQTVARSGERAGLAVLKTFGDHPPEGFLSFPRAGVTLSLDLQNRGASTLALLEGLDRIVIDAGGAVYPGKDGRMSARTFAASFPSLQAFTPHVDPRFSSSFWRRVAS